MTVIISFDCYAQAITKEEAVEVYNQVKKIKSYVEPWDVNKHFFVAPDSRKFRISCGSSKAKMGDPLVLVDGVLKEMSILNSINPQDIESIEILKDKPAIDKYGDKAKHGVILITMKCKEQNVPVL